MGITSKLHKLYHDWNISRSTLYYKGDYSSWGEATRAAEQYGGAYADSSILERVAKSTQLVRNGEAAYEQDGVTFDKLTINYPLISSFLYTYAKIGNLAVLDVGGALGSTYFRYRKLWDELNAKWTVIEQAHYVEYGKNNVPEIQFLNNVNEYEEKPSVILLSSVLAYLDQPYEMLKNLMACGSPYIIIDETAFHPDNRESITLEFVPESIYKAVYPLHLFSIDKFKNFVSENGYEIINEWDFEFGNIPLREKTNKVVDTIEKGFLLRKC